MSIELKIKEKQILNNDNENKDNSPEEEGDKNLKKKKVTLDQKYKIDIIDAFGANTNDNLNNPINFITHNNYLIYNVGYHILIKDFPPNEEDKLTEKEINKQSNSFFIYLSPYLKKITSLSVSYDKNNFAICEELEKDNIQYSTISMYHLSKLNILTYFIIEPSRKIITDKYYNFKSINFSDDNRYLCAFCSDVISHNIQAVIYNIQDYRDFKLNETSPYLIIDLLKEIDTKNININDINNLNSMVTFSKISFDNNNILCTSGNNNLNFWYISNSRYKKIPNLMTKTKNFMDHSFYKFKSHSNYKDKDNSILFTISSINELFILQSSQKPLTDEQSNKSNNDINDIGVNDTTSINSNIEQFIIKYYICNIFDDITCISTKIDIINNTDYFEGLIIGNNYGDVILYEKSKKEDINNFEYNYYKKFEKKNHKSKCTSITFNYNKSLLCISYENNEISYCYIKKIFPQIKKNEYNIFSTISDGFHNYPIQSFDVSLQRPILVTSSLKDNKIKVWNYISGYSEYCKMRLPEGQEHLIKNFIVLSFALHPNGYYLALANEEMIWFFFICHKEIRFYGNEISEMSNSKNNKKRVFLQKRNNCHLLKFSNGGHKLLAVNDSKNIFIIATFSREILNCFHLNHLGKINDVILSDDDIYLYSFGSDGCIYEVNIITEDVERIISTHIRFIKGFFFYTYNKKNVNIYNNNNNIKDLTPDKYYNVIACGCDIKENYSITEITYVPINESKDTKESIVVSSEMSFLPEKITCIIIVRPKKIEKLCIVCGTKDGKIILFPSPFKDAECKWDEVKTHIGRVNNIVYMTEVNMIISSGDDGNIFIYSLYEILGETVLYDKRVEGTAQLNTTLDIALGNSVLFPLSELEKIEINKNEEKDIEEKFEEEKEKIGMEHKNNITKLFYNMNLKFELDKKNIRKKIELLNKELNKNKDDFKLELENKDKELEDKLSKDMKENSNKLYKYQKELKELREQLKMKKEKYKNDIEKKKEDYKNKFEEISKGFDDKLNNLLDKQKELNEKYLDVKKDKKAFINNIEKEGILENELRGIEQDERNNEYKYNYGNLSYDIIKYKDLIEKLESNIKNKKKEIEELVAKSEYLEKVLDKTRDDNSQLLYDKEKVTEEFKELQKKMQNNETSQIFNNKLRVELYKQKYELTSKYKETTIENNIEAKTNKSLSKNIINLTNVVLSYEKDKNKTLFNAELIKKENEKLRTELNIKTQKLDNIVYKVFRSFQTHNKSEILRCLCDIYKKYVTNTFITQREKKLIDKKIILELENQINTLEEQININKSHIKEMEDTHDRYKEERIKENSILINECKNNRLRSQSLARSIHKLKSHSKLLSSEISKIKNNSSSVLSSNDQSKELKKNTSTTEALPPINFYKYKNTSSVLPSSIIKADNEDYNSPSKKGSFFSKSSESKRHSSDVLSEHTSFDDEKNLFS